MLERFASHHRTKIGTADTNVDYIPDSLSGVTFPFATADAIRKISHPGENSMNFGHHVLAVHKDGGIPRRTQSHVQDSAIFGEIDFFPAEHGFDPLTQTALLRQSEQQLDRLVRYQVLRIIEEQACCLGRQAFTALRVLCEQFPKMQFPK